MIPADAVALGVGAFFGAMSRYQAGQIAAEWIAKDSQRLGKFAGWHTAGINIGGSFLLGSIAGCPMKPPPPTTTTTTTTPPSPVYTNIVKPHKIFENGISPRTKLMLGVGFCGSFTTFSTFSVDVVTWLSEGKTSRALSYVATNNVGCFVAAASGMALVRRLYKI